jgi:group II intron reverse transcriptase/maturase
MSNQQSTQRDHNARLKKRSDMSSHERLQQLQRKLYLKAKQEKGYKFYVLYDKVFLSYILKEAYRVVKSRGGSAGIDNVSFKEIEASGLEAYLNEIGEQLRSRSYRPDAVKRVWIKKANGGLRPLGIPTIRDRVAQAACKLIIEPIFEADFEDSSYGYRPKRDAQGAMKAIKENLQTGKSEVYDADLSGYFDSIPHDKLLIAIGERVADKRIHWLIKLWLKAPVYEEGKYSSGKKRKAGTPQGAVLSPLLANIYLNLLDRIINKPGSLFAQYGIEIIRYADDFILMGRTIPEVILKRQYQILSRMGLTINSEKSKRVNAKESPFDFLGFTVRYDRSIFDSSKRFWHIRPSDKSQRRIRQNINMLLKRIGHYRPEDVVAKLNARIRGWLNYFDVPGISYTKIPKRKLNWYLRNRLYRYYNRKSQRKSRLYRQQAFNILVDKYGLIDPICC